MKNILISSKRITSLDNKITNLFSNWYVGVIFAKKVDQNFGQLEIKSF